MSIGQILRLDRRGYAELKAQPPHRARYWGFLVIYAIWVFITMLLLFQFTPTTATLGALRWKGVLDVMVGTAMGLCYQLTWSYVSTNWSPLQVIERNNVVNLLGISLIPRILGFIAVSGGRLLFHLSNDTLLLIIFLPFLGYELVVVSFGFAELGGEDFRRIAKVCMVGSLISGGFTFVCLGLLGSLVLSAVNTQLAFLITGLFLVSVGVEGPAGGFTTIFSVLLLSYVLAIYSNIGQILVVSLLLLNGILGYGLHRYRKWEERSVFFLLLLLLCGLLGILAS